MNYGAITLYVLGAYLTYRGIRKATIKSEARDMIANGRNTINDKIALAMAFYFMGLIWPAISLYTYGFRRYHKIRRLISKKK